jgi:hypothetical protein
MLKAVIKLFQPTDTNRQRLNTALAKLKEERQFAEAQMTRAKSALTEAALATGRGDTQAPDIATKALREHDEAMNRLKDLDHMIEATRAGLAEEDRKDEERTIDAKRQQVERLLGDYEAEAADIDKTIQSLAESYQECQEIMAKIYGLMPGIPRDLRHLSLRSAITEQLGLATNDFGDATQAEIILGLNRIRSSMGRPQRGSVLNVGQTAQRHGDVLLSQFPEPKEAA